MSHYESKIKKTHLSPQNTQCSSSVIFKLTEQGQGKFFSIAKKVILDSFVKNHRLKSKLSSLMRALKIIVFFEIYAPEAIGCFATHTLEVINFINKIHAPKAIGCCATHAPNAIGFIYETHDFSTLILLFLMALPEKICKLYFFTYFLFK